MYVSYVKKEINRDFTQIRRLLFYSIDGIGDAVLESVVITRLPEIFPQAQITVFCQKVSVDFFKRCPCISRIISIDSQKAHQEKYLDDIFRQLDGVKADASLNLVSVPSSGLVMFLWAAGAPIISVSPHLPARVDELPEEKAYLHDFARSISAVIPLDGKDSSELAKMEAVLRAFGLEAGSTHFWISKEDERKAEKVFAESGLDPAHNIALAGVSSASGKDYPRLADALLPLCRAHGLSVTAMGGPKERAANSAILRELEIGGIKTFNACGQTRLSVSAALLRKSCFVLGVDTGLLHMACALGLPGAVILGCSNIGRVWPHSRRVSMVCLPLSCMNCGGNCPYPEMYCISGIQPETVREAVQSELENLYPERFQPASSGKAPGHQGRVFMQKSDIFTLPKNAMRWQSPHFILDHDTPAERLRYCISRPFLPASGIIIKSGASGKANGDA